MEEVLQVDESICQQLLSSGLNTEGIQASLKEKGISDDDLVAAYMDTIKKMRYSKRRNMGFTFMAAGAFLGFLSCVLTISHVLPQMFDFIFYGLTTLAVCIVVLGLYYVFE
ncbi:MAG: hypothetical protein JNM14_00515 [Ferruginibacter sp.]|nr:hypothetical protein [Ferruginibacter sp.]